jgi:hypothetical protein
LLEQRQSGSNLQGWSFPLSRTGVVATRLSKHHSNTHRAPSCNTQVAKGRILFCTVKMFNDFPVPSRDGTNQPNSLWTGINKLFPAWESLVIDIPAGDEKIYKLFYSVLSDFSFLTFYLYFLFYKTLPVQLIVFFIL